MNEEEDDFQAVKAKPRKAKRNSGLYSFLINDKHWMQKLNLDPQQVTRKSDKGYVIIELDLGAINTHPKLTPVSWHIRIDATYNTKKDFLAQWHYTLHFIDDSKQEKTIHAYFHHGVFLCLFIDGKEITDKDTLNMIHDHTVHAKDIALSLIALLQDKQKSLTAEFNAAAAKLYAPEALQELSDELLKQTLDQCRSIHGELRLIDEEATKSPVTFLENRVKFIGNRRAILLAEAKAAETAQALDDTKSPASQTSSDHMKPKRKTQASKTKKISEPLLRTIKGKIEKIKKELRSIKANEILAAHASINNTQQEILQLYKEYPGSTETLDNLYLDLTAGKSITEIYKDLVNQQEFAAAMDLLSSSHEDQEVMFYGELLSKIFNMPMNKATEAKYVKFCEFLYLRSEHYRSALSIFSTSMIEYEFKGVSYGYSTLFYMALKQKNDLFKTFYTQLNSTTLIGQKCNGRVSDLLTAIIDLGTENALVQFLLDQGHPCENSLTNFYSLASRIKPDFAIGAIPLWHNTPDSVERIVEQNIQLSKVRDLVAVPSAFYHACLEIIFASNQQVALKVPNLILLAEKSSLTYLIIGFALLIGTADRGIRMACPEEPLIVFFSDDEKRLDIARALSTMSNKAKSIAMLMLVKNDEQSELFSQIAQILSDKIDCLSDDDMMALHANLAAMIEVENRIVKEQPAAASYNLLFALHLARVISAMMLPQNPATYEMLKNSVRALIQHMQGFAAQLSAIARKQIVLTQTIAPKNIIEGWIGGFTVLANDLERLDYWKQATTFTSTPLFDAQRASDDTLMQIATTAEQTPRSANEEATQKETKTPEATKNLCIIG